MPRLQLSNKAIAGVFREVETLLRVLGEDEGRAIAYGRVSRLIETLPQSAADLAAQGRLTEVKGIGPKVEKAVAELLDRGTCSLRDDLAARVAPGALDLLRVPGLGPKRVHTVVAELGVRSVEDLERAARDGRLASLPGIGAKTAQKLLEGIAFLNRSRGLLRLPDARTLAESVAARLGLGGALFAGPLRRGVPVVDSVSVLAAGDPGDVDLPGSERDGDAWVLPRGAAPAVRVRLVPREGLARALFEETGPAEHVASVLTRPGRDGSEEEIYASRGLHFVPPERRHACDGTAPVPRLVERGDLRGLVHAHTRWSDGSLTVAEMAAAAKERGYAWLGITDHSRVAAYANGLSIERLQEQAAEIRAFNAEGHGIRVLHGTEVDILPDGSLDYPDEVLAELDFVIASVHSAFTQPEEKMTARMVRAARSPHVDVIGHLTGLLRLRRDPYAVDVGQVLAAAAEAGTAVELNANPWRLDLDPCHHARAVGLGIGVPIAPDAHSAEGMDDVEWGVLAARHGGLRPEDVPNTRDAEEFP